MPRTGIRQWTLRHPKGLINVLVAGMLVLVGIQVSASSSPTLKAHRLERSQAPEINRLYISQREISCHGKDAHGSACPTSDIHDFVYSFLPASTLVTDYTRTRIGIANTGTVANANHLTGTASPRGPPETIS